MFGYKPRGARQPLWRKIPSQALSAEVTVATRSLKPVGLRTLSICVGVLLLSESNVAAGYLAHWRFENGTASSSASGTGSILDASGHGHNGTPINGPVHSSSVPFNPVPMTGSPNSLSLDFNGINQRVFIPDSPEFALADSFTIEASFFVRSSSPSLNSQILFRGDDRGGFDPYYLTVTGSSIRLVINSTTSEAVVTAALPGYNQWVHAAGTLDDATGRMNLYVNGVLASSIVTLVRPLTNLDLAWSPGLGIGNTQGSAYPQYFDGRIDEVRIADRALVPSEFLNASPANPVPEPTSFVLFVLGLATATVGSRRSSRQPRRA